VILACLLALLPVPALAIPPEFSADYVFERGRITVGETRMELERSKNNIYRYTSVAEATGFISLFVRDVLREESIFHFDGEGFWPISYAYRHEGSKKNRNEHVAYDWTSRTARLNYRGHTSEIALQPGAMDRFLLQVAIMHDVRDMALDKTYQVIDNGGIRRYRLSGDKSETIETPAGTFKTVRVERADGGNDKRLRFWLAPELNYLPVRIEQERLNEETLRLSLKAYRFAEER
jgi:hypothetical protein